MEEASLNVFNFKNHEWRREKQWRSQTNTDPMGRCSVGACAVPGNAIVSLGGFRTPDSRSVAVCEKIYIDGGRSQTLPSLNIPRACCGALHTSRGLLAIAGGTSMFNDAEGSNSSEILLDGAEEWVMGPQLNEVRIAPGVCNFYDDKQYVVGGFGGGNHYVKSTEVLSSDGRFTIGPRMNASRSGPCCLVSPYNDIWAIGGGENAFTNVTSCERLDPREGKWSFQLRDSRLGRRCFAAAFCGYHLVVYGGWIATEWHIPTLCTFDIRQRAIVNWVDLPPLTCGTDDNIVPIIPYQFVAGCFVV